MMSKRGTATVDQARSICLRMVAGSALLCAVFSSASAQQSFDTPQAAAEALVNAARAGNSKDVLNIFGYRDSYKLGLSILWGIYALGLIVLGIYGHKKHLRIGAIALFGVTLLKLFFYDIADLDTISKTIVFVSLGILMLIVSFLYNKYKTLIFETNES